MTVLGLLPIEEIEAGMQVYSTDEKTGRTEIKEVVQTFVNQTYELVHVKLEDGEEISVHHRIHSIQIRDGLMQGS